MVHRKYFKRSKMKFASSQITKLLFRERQKIDNKETHEVDDIILIAKVEVTMWTNPRFTTSEILAFLIK